MIKFEGHEDDPLITKILSIDFKSLYTVLIKFECEVNDLQHFIRSVAGLYVKYTDGTNIIEEVQTSLNTGYAILKTMKDKNCLVEFQGGSLYIKEITFLSVDQEYFTETWSMTSALPIKFKMEGVIDHGVTKTKLNPGYHLTEIKKGKLGDLSKIQEELEEVKDAEKQGSKIMTLIELSDMFAATERYLDKHFNGTVSLNDLIKMANITHRAFESGERKSD
jgi:hypothetical protein